MPFSAPPAQRDRKTVLHKPERARVLRWDGGTEAYDPKTRIWTPKAALSEAEPNNRQITKRETFLGRTFGSRPGIYEFLSWKSHADGGHIDLEAAILRRVQLGADTSSNKLAPSMPIPPEALAELAR